MGKNKLLVPVLERSRLFFIFFGGALTRRRYTEAHGRYAPLAAVTSALLPSFRSGALDDHAGAARDRLAGCFVPSPFSRVAAAHSSARGSVLSPIHLNARPRPPALDGLEGPL